MTMMMTRMMLVTEMGAIVRTDERSLVQRVLAV